MILGQFLKIKLMGRVSKLSEVRVGAISHNLGQTGVSSHCGSFRVRIRARIRVKLRVALMTEEEKVEFRVWWPSVVTMETRQNWPKINENGIPAKSFKGTRRPSSEHPNTKYVGPVSIFNRRLCASLATGGHPNRATSL